MENYRKYRYVGEAGADDFEYTTERRLVCEHADIWQWCVRQETSGLTGVTVTFVVDTRMCLWIADRQSEHVACARGGDVIAAGEMTFARESGIVVVSRVTNLSTGYCPGT